jgi:hypothetical protein
MIVGQDVIEKSSLPTFCWKLTNKGSVGTERLHVILIR